MMVCFLLPSTAMSVWTYFLGDERQGRPGVPSMVGTDRWTGPEFDGLASKNVLMFSVTGVEWDWNR